MDRKTAINLIIAERLEQIKKWGDVYHSRIEYVSLLSEELGEVARAASELHWNGMYYDVSEIDMKQNYKDELIQIAALCVAALEAESKKS